MKNQLIALCVVTTLVTSVTGCGCCRRLRDFVCRGARCGGPTAAITAPAPAPLLAPPPVAAAPMIDPGCSYAGFDPGCAYGGGQVVGFPPTYDSGWMPAGPACESCSGGYELPSYPVDGGYPIDSSGSSDPGPAPAPSLGGGSGTR